MPDRVASVWNDERLEKLKKFWEQGLSITQIGIRLGVTRNAVVGKVHRQKYQLLVSLTTALYFQ